VITENTEKHMSAQISPCLQWLQCLQRSKSCSLNELTLKKPC